VARRMHRAEFEQQAPIERRERRAEFEHQAPIVRVTIGRIEVRAEIATPAAAPPAAQPVRAPTLTLDEYLKQRQEGKR
jgi:hypothetical protein